MNRPSKHSTPSYKAAYKALKYKPSIKQVFPDFRSKGSRGKGTNKLQAEPK